MTTHKRSHKAFTIVELLTVMGVIALLIGLLVPALSKVKEFSKKVKQGAQFHSISIALEMFKQDEGEYPDSSQTPGATYITTRAQKLAAALVGRDLQGYDTLSTWDAYADDNGSNKAQIYASTGKSSTPQDISDSMARRKGPYLTLENVGAFNIDQLYPGVNPPIYGRAPVPPATTSNPGPFITDVFADRQVTLTLTSSTGTQIQRTVKAGTPVLYYKANPSNLTLGKGTPTPLKKFNERTYNYYDNQAILAMGRMMNPATLHKMYDNSITDDTATSGANVFYDTITNPQVSTTPEGVSYRPDSFILMSAGKDGIFGTADDIYNFGE